MAKTWRFMVLAAVLGCGGGSSSGGGTFMTSVPGSAPINTLTPTQVQTLCTDLSNYQKTAVPASILCRPAGIIAGDLAAQGGASDSQATQACNDAVTQCEKDPSATSGTSGAMSGTMTTMCNPPPTCTATVSEFGACITDIDATFKQFLAQFPTCAQVNSGTNLTPPADPAEPDSCKVVDMKCPSNTDGGATD
jgi:hypothetical protein